MARVLLGAVLMLSASVGAAERGHDRWSTVEMLRWAAEQSARGNRARAKLMNEARAHVPELIEALKHEDDDVRVSAAWGLRYATDNKPVAALIEAMRDPNFGVSRAAGVSTCSTCSLWRLIGMIVCEAGRRRLLPARRGWTRPGFCGRRRAERRWTSWLGRH